MYIVQAGQVSPDRLSVGVYQRGVAGEAGVGGSAYLD